MIRYSLSCTSAADDEGVVMMLRANRFRFHQEKVSDERFETHWFAQTSGSYAAFLFSGRPSLAC